MTRFSLVAVALAFTTLHTAPAQAEPISSLEECYNTVITWCVETFPEHADQCGQSTHLQECDDEFGDRGAMNSGRVTIGPVISPHSFERLMAGAARLDRPVLRAASR